RVRVGHTLATDVPRNALNCRVVPEECGRQRTAEPGAEVSDHLDYSRRVKTVVSKRPISFNLRGRHSGSARDSRGEPFADSVSRRRFRLSVKRLCLDLDVRGHLPMSDRFQRPFEKLTATGVTLNLPARGFIDRAGLDENDGIRLKLVALGDTLADGLK